MRKLGTGVTIASVALATASFSIFPDDFRSNPNPNKDSPPPVLHEGAIDSFPGVNFPSFEAKHRAVPDASVFEDPKKAAVWFLETMLAKRELTVGFTSEVTVLKPKGETELFPVVSGTSIMTLEGVDCNALIGGSEVSYRWNREEVFTKVTLAGKDSEPEVSSVFPGWNKVGFIFKDLPEELGFAGCDHFQSGLLRGWIWMPEYEGTSPEKLEGYSFPHFVARIIGEGRYMGEDKEGRHLYTREQPRPVEPYPEDIERGRVKEVEWRTTTVVIDPNSETVIVDYYNNNVCKKYGPDDPVVTAELVKEGGVSMVRITPGITEKDGELLYTIRSRITYSDVFYRRCNPHFPNDRR